MMAERLRILHLHSTFAAGGKELRAVRLMNAFGSGVEHSIVSAVPGALQAQNLLAKSVQAEFPDDFPALAGRPTPGRLQKLARAMRGHDLILTYNWGAMDAVMAHLLFGQMNGLAPLIHHEDGFNADEAERRKAARNWYRRIALAHTAALVVPSCKLATIARQEWQQPATRIHRIANGVPTSAYGCKAKPDALRGVVKRPGESWLGTMAGLRAVKNLPRLVRAFADLPEYWQLVILGEGPERDAIRAEAVRLDIGHRVHLPGHVAEPAGIIGLFDMFALSSDSEQFPLSVVEAMAAGLAIAAPDVGDVASIVCEANRPYIVPAGDEAALASAIAELAQDASLRATLGSANRVRAREHYDESDMIAAYRKLYARALGRARFP